MNSKINSWIKNAPIKVKFIPLQVLTLIIIFTIGIISVASVLSLNNMSQTIFTTNVSKAEDLNEIIRTMYRCRVLGRDILLQEDPERQLELYGEYIIAFDDLDAQMDAFASRLAASNNDSKLERFNIIIEQKNVYKESMILSADIRIQGGDYYAALDALTSVTPIANEFFGSIDLFLADEEALMEEALIQNDEMVNYVFIVVVVTNILSIVFVYYLVDYFSKKMSESLVALEHSVSLIAQTNNMKTPIPGELFTKDEIGLIAKVVDNLRQMLLAYSFNDALTGGYNATAYYEELADIFNEKTIFGDEENMHWCVLFDMNNLKVINDTLGHVEGDTAIKLAHKIIVSCFEEYGKVFRIGGDEFVAILRGCTSEQIEEMIGEMLEKIEMSNKNKSQKFSVAYGFGQFSGNSREEFEENFNLIDKKMYINKEQLKQARARPLPMSLESYEENKTNES